MFSLISNRNAFGTPILYRTASEAGIKKAGADLVIEGSGTAIVDGNYVIDGSYSGSTRWKHNTESIWVALDGTLVQWVIGTSNEPDFGAGAIYTEYVGGVLPSTNSGDWDIGAFVTMTINAS